MIIKAIHQNQLNVFQPFAHLFWHWAYNYGLTVPEYHGDEFEAGHPAEWFDFDKEFCDWVKESTSLDPWKKENLSKIHKLAKYLIKHKIIKRQLYWNSYIYQIDIYKMKNFI